LAENICIVPIGEMLVSKAPGDVLVAYGLGSCVAICLYDPAVRAGGILHALLPTATDEDGINPTRFVDRGAPLLVNSLLKLGASYTRLTAYLCGGAQIISVPDLDDSLNIGERNVLAAEAALQALGLRVQARATGSHIGRTVRLYIANGQVTVKTLRQGEQIINTL
jgi:chemotaxis protein CheD